MKKIEENEESNTWINDKLKNLLLVSDRIIVFCELNK